MSDHPHDEMGRDRAASPDPWASLADELGISPGEAQRAETPPKTQPVPPPRPRPKPAQAERPRPTAPTPGWDDLATELGLQPDSHPATPPRQLPQQPPAASRPTRPEISADAPPATPRRDDTPAHRDMPVRDAASPTEEDAFLRRPISERRPERTRGETPAPERERDDRRGRERHRDRDVKPLREPPPPVVNDSGFGEGLFEAPRVGHGDRPRRESSALHGEAPFPAEDGPGESHADADRESGEAGGERRPRRRRGRRGGRGRRTREDGRVGEGERIRGDQEPVRDDLLGAAIRPANPDDLFEGERGESPQSSDSVEPADEAAPRRRRRGRRGGRGRSRTGSGESRSVGESSNLAGGERRQPEDGEADEPLPSGYGVRPTAGRGDADERRGERPPEGDSGRPRRRGRRRRSSGDGGARAAGTEKPTSSDAGRRSSRSRRDRRPDAESRGDAGFSRRRRGDFEPVGSGHGEDDEGLEFLGIDEAGSGSSRREARAPDDDILVESGLSSVQDVPSWVEAIGIVIAGNLDARNRSPRGDEGRRTGR